MGFSTLHELRNQKKKSDLNSLSIIYSYLPIVTFPHHYKLKKSTLLFFSPPYPPPKTRFWVIAPHVQNKLLLPTI